MIFNLNGNRAVINSSQLQYSGGTLVFDVSGDTFPKSNFSTVDNPAAFALTKFEVINSGSNTMSINYGDGNIISYNSISNAIRFNPSIPLGNATNLPIHPYTDGNSGRRLVQITFSNPEKVIQININYVNLYGLFPINIDKLLNLNTLFVRISQLTSFPVTISNLVKLRTLTLSSIGTAISLRIPNEFLNLKLVNFEISGSVNLNNTDSSNFINFLESDNKLTLQLLSIDSCQLTSLPNELSNLTQLKTLNCGSTNPISIMPTVINQISSLTALNIGANVSTNNFITQWTSFSNLINLITNTIHFSPNMTTDLPPDLVNCIKLKTYNANSSYNTIARVNTFIDNVYLFITTNAAITGATSLPFRGMTIQCTGGSVTGTYQQPSGYVAGASNGTPTSQKEKIWILVNQYAATVTYTT